MKVLAEKDGFVFGQEADEVRALGVIVLLGTLTRLYGQEAMFLFTDRVRQHIENKQYGILYQKLDNGKIEGAVPVAFITWARLSAPCAVIFEERLRPLQRHELQSGGQLWVVDLCAPMGHMLPIREAFEEATGASEYYATRARDGRLRKEIFKSRKPK